MKNASRILFTFLALASATASACSSSSSSGGDGAPRDLAFHSEAPALPGFSYDTGLQPPSGPAQMSLKLVADGNVSVDAAATAAGGKVDGKPGGGKLKLDVHIKLQGHLKADVSAVHYDGDIPGLAGVDVPIGGQTAFDGLLLGGPQAQVDASLPETKLPDIPLGTVPGHLSITVAAGSKITVTYKGSCVDVHAGKATYSGVSTISGSVVLHSQLVLDIPLVKPIDLPPVTVPIPSTSKPLASAPVDAAGVSDSTTGTCASGPGGPDGTDGGGGNDGTTPPPPGDSGGPGDGSSGGDGASDATIDGGDDTACGAMSTANACYQCCQDAHPAAAQTYTGLIQTCACTNPGTCNAQCGANYCVDPTTASNDCVTCVQGTTCIADAHTQCDQIGASCAAYPACTGSQGCANKP